MTVAAFMDAALHHPQFGYYARASRRSGSAGDFFTSADLGPLFGRLLAEQIAEMADHLSAPPAPFTLVEAGAGDGRLSAAVMRGLDIAAPALSTHLHLHLAERSAAARRVHGETLQPWNERLISSDEPPASFDGVLFANELLDAMPVHQVVMRDELREVFVAVDGDRLVAREATLSSPALAEYLARAGITLPAGARAEVPLAAEAWIRDAASRLRRGFMILIDYGDEAQRLYSGARFTGTLTSYRQHRQSAGGDDAWLERPGECDLTAHVDLSSVRAAAESSGCATLGLCDQTYFLMALAAPLLDSFDVSERQAFKSLIMPGGLGSTMKVLVLGKGVGRPVLRGCSGPSRLS